MGLKKLIQKCSENDTKAQGELYHLYSRVLFSVSLKYSRNYAEAEDNLQDAFVTIFKKIAQYQAKGSFEGWLKRIVINTALQRYRKQDVFEIIDEEKIKNPSVEVQGDEDIPLDYLLSCIQKLPDRYRLVFNLYVMDGYSHKDIAEMLTISTGTSKSNLARARLILKENIEQYLTQLNSQSL
ncbi:RNA polymerase sigma-70 factor [Mangrovimonas yunxiaonensis]|uniref:RNA polymerase sigma-70 factor n=1 Tax=Mangrovimonas yunxiaonensis TaxID=1197477 RepID=A0A084TKF8_9FLAO|nr:RNA polymerase sigma factor [Mangrovimonas yunxiaonensis]KFB01194.1 RNA polymerase sigma-70 factor [Mangrovimonas yunxiaonensis]GGH38123.1 DNA-directed RNA polymerase sigma-70 factor [Mangrovimonas yunxiaonensis]